MIESVIFRNLGSRLQLSDHESPKKMNSDLSPKKREARMVQKAERLGEEFDPFAPLVNMTFADRAKLARCSDEIRHSGGVDPHEPGSGSVDRRQVCSHDEHARI